MSIQGDRYSYMPANQGSFTVLGQSILPEGAPVPMTKVMQSPQQAFLKNVPLVQSEVQLFKQAPAAHIIEDSVDVSQHITVVEGAYKVVALTKEQLQ
jgi:hypothetical protein